MGGSELVRGSSLVLLLFLLLLLLLLLLILLLIDSRKDPGLGSNELFGGDTKLEESGYRFGETVITSKKKMKECQ